MEYPKMRGFFYVFSSYLSQVFCVLNTFIMCMPFFIKKKKSVALSVSVGLNIHHKNNLQNHRTSQEKVEKLQRKITS